MQASVSLEASASKQVWLLACSRGGKPGTKQPGLADPLEPPSLLPLLKLATLPPFNTSFPPPYPQQQLHLKHKQPSTHTHNQPNFTMDTAKNAANFVTGMSTNISMFSARNTDFHTDKVSEVTNAASKETNKAVAKDSDVGITDRAKAGKDYLGDAASEVSFTLMLITHLSLTQHPLKSKRTRRPLSPTSRRLPTR